MENAISVYCFTNLDNYKNEEWPSRFCCRPIVGDRVRAINSKRELVITSITHTGIQLLIYLDKTHLIIV